MKPVFVINALSETVAAKGSRLDDLPAELSSAVFKSSIFDSLDDIVTAGMAAGWVIIEGGDGTAQGVISAFLNRVSDSDSMPKFTLLPGGMTNQVAKNIGHISKKRGAITTLLAGQNQKSLRIPLVKISAKGYPDQFGFLFSSGGVPMITKYTKAKIHSKGIGGSMAVLAGILKGVSGKDSTVLTPSQIRLTINDNFQRDESHLGTLVTTLPSIMLGLDPFWGRNSDDALRITYVRKDPKHLARHVAGLWMGRKQLDRSRDGLHSWRAKTLDYDYDGPIVLDGEPLDMGPFFQITHTQAVTFLR